MLNFIEYRRRTNLKIQVQIVDFLFHIQGKKSLNCDEVKINCDKM